MPDDLLPCPFCGGEAEADYSRHYRALQSGQIGKSVAVYCTQCGADMTHCLEDHRGTDPEDLMADLVTAWNRREAATRLATPPGDAVEVVVFVPQASLDRLFSDGSHVGTKTAIYRRRMNATMVALSSIPERAHGEQMREAAAALCDRLAAEADEATAKLPAGLEAEASGGYACGMRDAAEAIRALPLPPAEERKP